MAENPQQQSNDENKSIFSGVLGSFTVQPSLTLRPEEDQSVQAGGLKVHGLTKPWDWHDHQVNYKKLVQERTGDPSVTVGGQDQIRSDAPTSMLAHATLPWNIHPEDLQDPNVPPANKEQAEIQARQREMAAHEQHGT